jgi:BolA protein
VTAATVILPEDGLGDRGRALRSALLERLAPVHLDILDESYMHSTGPGAQSHFKVVVVSERFAGQRLVMRHRAVNEASAAALAMGVHALSIVALTPDEWAARGGAVVPSPGCMGGGKH